MYKGLTEKGPFVSLHLFNMYWNIRHFSEKSREIKGITIDDTEYRLSQYADDTSLILDGSPAALDASLRLLQFYAEISGLKINLEKTYVIWIGSKKHSQRSYLSEIPLYIKEFW
jgi:hypothetical protein